MDVHEAIVTMLAVREYRPGPIPRDTLLRIVEAGRLTASARNAQPWHFVLVEDVQNLQRLADAAPSGPYLAGAAAAVAVAIDDGSSAMQMSDAARAIHSMALSAWGSGVGSNWVGFGGLAAVNAILGIPTEKHVIGILALGYPAKPVGKGKKRRRPLAEVASRERYGTPLT